MATILAIIAVISGAASISGLIIAWRRKTENVSKVIVGLLIAAILFSGYMLFVPGSAPVENVGSKIRLYSKKQDKDTLIQEGSFSFGGQGPIAIQFPTPYARTPKVEIVNINGYRGPDVPSVEYTTNKYFEVRRHGMSAAFQTPTPRFLQEYKWVSEGTPFKDASPPPQ